MDWEPIETAPKDGKSVLVWDFYETDGRQYADGRYVQTGNDGLGITVARYDAANGWHVSASVVGGNYIKLRNPTHWMPLPGKPKVDRS